MTVRYIPKISVIVSELLAVGNTNLTQRKEPHYCKSWNKLDLARKTNSTEYSVVFESECHITKNKFLETGKCDRFKKCKQFGRILMEELEKVKTLFAESLEPGFHKTGHFFHN